MDMKKWALIAGSGVVAGIIVIEIGSVSKCVVHEMSNIIQQVIHATRGTIAHVSDQLLKDIE